jgi:hypothetical protein
MKKSIFLLVGIFCLCLVGISWAGGAIQNIDLSSLSEEQKAQLVMQAEQMKKSANIDAEKSKKMVEMANEYTQLAENISTVVVTVAGKVGIAADEFLKSTSGKITVGLIFWKMAGKDLSGLIIHVIVGSSLFFIMLPIWIYMFRRMCLIQSIEIQKPESGFRSQKTIVYMDSSNEGVQITRWTMLAVLAVGVLVSVWTIFAY